MKKLGLPKNKVLLPDKIVFKTKEWSHYLLINIDQLAEHHAEQEISHWLEKTPRHLWYIDLISDVDPDTKFIHIIRRGENVAASMYFATKNYPEQWGGPRSIKKCVFWWNRSVQNSLRYLGQKNHIFISYEQLIHQPKTVVKKLCDHISLSHEENMHNSFHKTASSLIREGEDFKRKNTSKKISNSNKFDRLSVEDQQYIKENLIEFPYKKIWV